MAGDRPKEPVEGGAEGEAQDGWSCGKCTFLNEVGAVSCARFYGERGFCLVPLFLKKGQCIFVCLVPGAYSQRSHPIVSSFVCFRTERNKKIKETLVFAPFMLHSSCVIPAGAISVYCMVAKGVD